MLERDVDIVANFRLLPHYFQHVGGKTGRKGVVQPDPLDPFYLDQGAQQVGQGTSFIQVQAVIGQVLGNQDKFTHALGGQALGFLYQVFYGLAAVAAPHERDGAE